MTDRVSEMFWFLCLALIVPALCDDCDKYGTLLYEDLGCTPEFAKDKKCPVKYNCEGLEFSDKNCYFKGKIYQDGELIDSSLTEFSCIVGCFCSADGSSSGFICAVLDCAEFFGVTIPPGCYRNYSLDSCCSVGEICGKIETCTFRGEEYLEGQKFNPEDTCLNCVCQKGFQGKLEEPFCRRRSCGEQLQNTNEIQKSCAPFYSKELNEKVLCCPDNWMCPDGTEGAIQGNAKSDEKCKYGGKSLNVGQYFEKSNVTDSFGRNFEKIRCECVIPPFVMCRDV